MQYYKICINMQKLHLFFAKNFNHNQMQLSCNFFLHHGCTIDAIIYSVLKGLGGARERPFSWLPSRYNTKSFKKQNFKRHQFYFVIELNFTEDYTANISNVKI